MDKIVDLREKRIERQRTTARIHNDTEAQMKRFADNATGRITLIVPMDDITPDFHKRLYVGMCAIMQGGVVNIHEMNFANERGEQIMFYNIDIEGPGTSPDAYMDQVISECAWDD